MPVETLKAEQTHRGARVNPPRSSIETVVGEIHERMLAANRLIWGPPELAP
jgi:hypothetical protein